MQIAERGFFSPFELSFLGTLKIKDVSNCNRSSEERKSFNNIEQQQQKG